MLSANDVEEVMDGGSAAVALGVRRRRHALSSELTFRLDVTRAVLTPANSVLRSTDRFCVGILRLTTAQARDGYTRGRSPTISYTQRLINPKAIVHRSRGLEARLKRGSASRCGRLMCAVAPRRVRRRCSAGSLRSLRSLRSRRVEPLRPQECSRWTSC